mmetsp:Transcript_83907/g.246055  ORF Transcript_83907/g.246055 Transcript_83907/m.246055 type:complete len:250 (+) Transcript_83907:1287-2036(+)
MQRGGDDGLRTIALLRSIPLHMASFGATTFPVGLLPAKLTSFGLWLVSLLLLLLLLPALLCFRVLAFILRLPLLEECLHLCFGSSGALLYDTSHAICWLPCVNGHWLRITLAIPLACTMCRIERLCSPIQYVRRVLLLPLQAVVDLLIWGVGHNKKLHDDPVVRSADSMGSRLCLLYCTGDPVQLGKDHEASSRKSEALTTSRDRQQSDAAAGILLKTLHQVCPLVNSCSTIDPDMGETIFRQRCLKQT